MKKMLLIVVIILVSCNLFKQKNESAQETLVVSESVEKDSLVIIQPDTIREYNFDDFIFKEIRSEESYDTDEYMVNSPEPKPSTQIIESINIDDRIDTSELTKDDIGLIAYNIPDKFKVNEYSTITLRITKEGTVKSVVIGDRNIPIIDTSSNDKVIVESINVDTLMKAKLHADEDVFEISLKSEYEQSISIKGYTEWEWRVKPLKGGEHYIKLTIYISGKDLVVYDEKIPTENNFFYSLTKFLEKWWQLISATIIIPIIIPLVKWYNKKKNS